MLHFAALPVLAVFTWLPQPPQSSAADPKAIIEQAAAALGGIETLAKYPAGISKIKGTYHFKNQEIPFGGQSVYHMPDRAKSTIELNLPGANRTIEQVMNGNKSGMYSSGIEQHASDNQIQEMRTSAYCRNVCRLAPLLKDGKFTLATAGEKTVDGKKLVGVKVSSQGQKDVTLYFDPTTHLLQMLERPGFDANGKAVEQQEVFSDYRTAGGLKYAGKTRVLQLGKPVVDSEVLEYKPLERIDPKEFAGAR